MKFVINQKDLVQQLNIVNKGISNNNIQPILSGIYIETTTYNTLILRGTDMELGIECQLDITVEEPGKIVIPSKYFVEMMKKLPAIDLYFTTGENKQLKIDYGASELKLNFYDGEEYPAIHDFIGNIIFTMKGEDLNKGIQRVQVAVSNDSNRPIFTGVLLEIKENRIHFVSSDTHRLCHTSMALDLDNIENTEVIVPAKSLKEIASIINPEDNVEIHLTDNRILFKIENRKIVSRLIEGKFVNYSQVIPSQFGIELKIMRRSFLETLDRAFLLTRDELKSKLNTVKLNIEENKLIVSCKSSEIGDIYEEIPIYSNGGDLELGFNAKYLIEVLRALDTEEVVVKLSTPQNPGIIEPISDTEDVLYLILPVRLQ
ncbi:hypothetical protein AZF37_00015 [endosymbiont 'TC1' of Trimyema compressum]|uniref:DNA polymerase III subunit beta n=1 Tax=endosymbiont 'TC1' of Trimyema compressum TaxID=243899 RepID=UPI0007F06FAE|nr:DNA polymerase III subunit beta [endosymbiont 'TC1' of Trimyema compressum]AMP19770.1 hypothetical protein AZF37_00015 [endosymbiont 'TC1' of Trimyema compressum]